MQKIIAIEGNILNNGGTKRVRIEIGADGLISQVSEPTGSADTVLNNEIIFPGFIDLHVHARECVDHSQDYKEDFQTACEAAINGGVVALMDMPNNPVPPVDEKSYEEKKELTQKSVVEVVLYAGIGPNTNPLLKPVPYKVFMGHSVGNLFFTSYEDLDSALSKYTGENVSFHCEDPKILETKKDESTHSERRPPEAEISAVDFALTLIRKYRLIGKICHCSTIEGVEKIIQARREGVSVTVEVTPTHLFFDDSVLAQMETSKQKFMQMNPPVRHSREDRLKLIEYLRQGDIDFIATDHAPHTIEEKDKGMSGLPQLDTYGSFVTWLYKEHKFSLEEIQRVCAENPAKFLNQFVRKFYGKIEKGCVGSLTVIDFDKSTTINKEILKTKCHWSPFEGISFPGSVVMTIVKGKIYAK
jgi:dihydroorotase